MKRSELKSQAKSQINSNILVLFLCHFIFLFVSNLGGLSSFVCRMYYYGSQFKDFWALTSPLKLGASRPAELLLFPSYPFPVYWTLILINIAVFVFVPALLIGLTKMYLGLAEGETPKIGEIFSGIKQLLPAFVMNLLVCVFTFLWSLLFIIPGIIKIFSYSMCYYIMAENPEMGPLEAIRRSKKMMKGYKFEYFILQLSFFWWHLLGAVTFGLAYVYIIPYMYATSTNFYNKIKDGQNTYEEIEEIKEISESAK